MTEGRGSRHPFPLPSRTLVLPADMGPLLEALAESARTLRCRAFIVGGFVRDTLLGGDVKDLDVVVDNLQGLNLARRVSVALDAPEPVLFERFGTAQVVTGDYSVEFVSARAESYHPHSRKPQVREASVEEDVMRRDFTCNTLLCDFAGNVFDLTGHGLTDLERGILRTPLDPAQTFSDDPLRMMRAVRFAAQLGFTVDPLALAAMRPLVHRLVSVVSVERTAEELRRLLLSPSPSIGFELMQSTGILAELLADIESMRGVTQGGYHNKDVYGHTLDALDASRRALLVRLAVLFHDAGKPGTRTVEDGGRIRFLGHAERSAHLAIEAMRRLRFSTDDTAHVAKLVEMHMRPVAYQDDWSDGAVRKLVRDAGELFDDLMDLAEADMRASDYPDWHKVNHLRERARHLGLEEVRRLTSPLDGHDLMQLAGRPPGPWVRQAKEALVDAILEGELIPEREAALAWLARHPDLLRG